MKQNSLRLTLSLKLFPEVPFTPGDLLTPRHTLRAQYPQLPELERLQYLRGWRLEAHDADVGFLVVGADGPETVFGRLALDRSFPFASGEGGL